MAAATSPQRQLGEISKLRLVWTIERKTSEQLVALGVTWELVVMVVTLCPMEEATPGARRACQYQQAQS